MLPIASVSITVSRSSICSPRLIAGLQSFLNAVVGLTVSFVFLTFSDRQKARQGRYRDIDDFLETVRRYTDAATITKRMVAELIDHIEVYHAEKQDGITNQRVVIYYNCIGAFDVPDRRKIPETDIIMETRKGVALSYAPERLAV